ncbi:MAG: MOSC domain-containing protein [Dehalococcoidia bacterium]|nr:MOSC domain-containing protein [Dehalococcoidia bacterium]
MSIGTVVQVNVSAGGVPKLPVAEGLVGETGIAGDGHNNTEHHGGPERALCLYALERILALQSEGHAIAPGTAGENLTLSGLDWDQFVPGVRLRLGEAVLVEVTGYTTPCYKIEASFSDGDFNRIHHATHSGWSRVYARVLSGGLLRPGDPVEVLVGQPAS